VPKKKHFSNPPKKTKQNSSTFKLFLTKKTPASSTASSTAPTSARHQVPNGPPTCSSKASSSWPTRSQSNCFRSASRRFWIWNYAVVFAARLRTAMHFRSITKQMSVRCLPSLVSSRRNRLLNSTTLSCIWLNKVRRLEL